MTQTNKLITLLLVVVLAVFLQVLFVFADTQDSPRKAAIEFAEAYVGYDGETLDKLLCEEAKVVDDVNVINAYLYRQRQRAENLGYSMNYMRDCLYHVDAETLEADATQAKVHLAAERKSNLRNFFGGQTHHLEETFELIREDGRWKVCGAPLTLQGT